MFRRVFQKCQGIGRAVDQLGRREFANLRSEVGMLMRREGGPLLRQARLDGFEMLVRADEEVGRQLYLNGRYEVDEIRFLRAAVRRGDICIDVGANVGYYTLVLSSLAAEGWVHSFEPVTFSYQLLEINKTLNGTTNVTLNQVALGDERGEREFCQASDSAYSSFVDTDRKRVESFIKVPMTTLDEYCREKELGKIDFLKADVEGAEPLVLSGAREMLSDPGRRPRLILMELYPPMLRKYGRTANEVVSCMEKLGYEAFVVDGERRSSYEEHRSNRFYNVFFELKRGADL
jgi:FkbM family methyltransferase